PLKVDNRSGAPVADIDLIPSVVISFLDRLIERYERSQYRPTRDRAIAWTMKHPASTFNWQAQFDDAKLRGAYQNLSKHEACEFAIYLLRQVKGSGEGSTSSTAIAEELIAFAEDQFVTWEQPPALKPRSQNMNPENWFTP